MLIHVVCFKYRANVSAAERASHCEGLRGLSKLEGIVELKVGEDVVHSQRSYDTGLVVTFPNRAALDRYQGDPLHIPVAQRGVALADHIVAVDFEV